ncbi:MAG: hypothetical protein ACI4B9_04415 [Eggerthellaceae bacterium]
MKVCPVCKATSFKDMDVCFGCMHRFGEPEESDFERGDDEGVLTTGPSAFRESGSVPNASMEEGARSQVPGASGVLSGSDGGIAGAMASSSCGLRPPADAGSGSVPASVAEEPVVLPVAGGGFDLVISIRPA